MGLLAVIAIVSFELFQSHPDISGSSYGLRSIKSCQNVVLLQTQFLSVKRMMDPAEPYRSEKEAIQW
jgi:hypothetical protein